MVNGGADVGLAVFVKKIWLDFRKLVGDFTKEAFCALLHGFAVHFGIEGGGQITGAEGIDEVQLEAVDVVFAEEVFVDILGVLSHLGITGVKDSALQPILN